MSRITVLRAEVSVPEGKKYKICELGYKTDDGKIKGMRIFGFGNMKPIFDVASAATKGDVLEASFQQNEKGYWEFANLENTGTKAATAPETSVSAPAARKGGDWETSEERARKQVYIVRQSSISAALEFLKHNLPKNAITVSDVVGVAKQFESYVFEKEVPTVE